MQGDRHEDAGESRIVCGGAGEQEARRRKTVQCGGSPGTRNHEGTLAADLIAAWFGCGRSSILPSRAGGDEHWCHIVLPDRVLATCRLHVVPGCARTHPCLSVGDTLCLDREDYLVFLPETAPRAQSVWPAGRICLRAACRLSEHPAVRRRDKSAEREAGLTDARATEP